MMSNHSFRYTPYYCEENVWHLCQEPTFAGLERKVVFISNAIRSCPFWSQRASVSPEKSVWWDYHVILLGEQTSWSVWDLDTLLDFPVDAEEYLLKTFRGLKVMPRYYHPFFRVIALKEFTETFSSDRSHMRNPSGEWLAPPPPWPPIMRGEFVTLGRFIDMNSDWVGEVLTLEEMHEEFGH